MEILVGKMKFKIVEEFLFYTDSYGQEYSIEKNPAKWKLPARGWVNRSGDIYAAFALKGLNNIIHEMILDTLQQNGIAENVPGMGWENEYINDWLAIIVDKGRNVYFGESYESDIFSPTSLENIKKIYRAAKRKNPSLTFVSYFPT